MKTEKEIQEHIEVCEKALAYSWSMYNSCKASADKKERARMKDLMFLINVYANEILMLEWCLL